MGLYEIKRMDDQEYSEYFRKTLDNFSDTLIDMLNLGDDSHSLELHCEMSDDDLAKRVMYEHHSCSTFTSKDDMNYFLGEALYFYAEDISNWLINTRERELEIYLDMGEPIGRGYDSNYKEKEGNIINVVLRRDYNQNTQTGFYVKTAYIDIDNEQARFTGKEYNIEKLFDREQKKKEFTKQMRQEGYQASYNDDSVIVKFGYNKKQYIVGFKSNDYSITEIDESTKSATKNLRLDDFILEDAQLTQRLNSIINIKEQIDSQNLSKTLNQFRNKENEVR